MTLARTPYARLSPADIGQVDRELKKLEQMSAGLYVPKVLVAARSPYTVQGTDTMLLCDCTAGAITLTFPLAARVDGMSVVVVKSDTSTNAVMLSGTFSGGVNPKITVSHAGYTVSAMNGVYHVTAGVTYPVLSGETGVTNMLYPFGDIRRYGAVVDAVTDDATAIQTAINAAQSVPSGAGATVTGPDGGVSIIGTMLQIDATKAPIRLIGQGMHGTVFRCKAGVGLASILKIGDALHDFTGNEIRNLWFDGNNVANRGIYSTRSNHTKIHGVRVQQTTTAGISLGYGWCNDVVDSELSFNSGDGLVFNVEYSDGGNNNCNVTRSRIFNNNGMGLKFWQGLGLNVNGCDFERNDKGAIYLGYNCLGYRIAGNYFETNGDTGWAFSTPAVTAHADIIINGNATDTTLAAAFPSNGALIEGNFLSTATGNETEFVFLGAVQSGRISANTLSWNGGGTPTNLVKYYASAATASDIAIEQNVGWSKDINVTNLPATGVSSFRKWFASSVVQRNYAEVDFLRWFIIAANSGGTFRRSTTVSYSNWPVWELAFTAGAQSDFWGFQLDLTKYPELQNQTAVFGFWAQVNTGGSVMEVVSYANGNVSSASLEPNANTWKWVECAITLGASGTASFAVYAQGLAAGRMIRFTLPTLVIAGAHMERLYPQTHDRNWAGTAVATDGAWLVGDRIRNRTPAVGSPKAWVCTVAGTPGTWVSEGNL